MMSKPQTGELKSKAKRSKVEAISGVSSVRFIPRFDETGDDFFEELYLALNPDVAAAIKAGLIPSGEVHWRKHGSEEALAHGGMRSSLIFKSPARPVVLSSPPSEASEGFDPVSYLYMNPDILKATSGHHDAALAHWLEYGRFEGRTAPGVSRPRFRRVNLSKLSRRPLGINLFGPFGVTSGLGTAARAMANAVKALGIPIELNVFDMTSGELRPASTEDRLHPTFRINLIMANADQMPRVFAAYREGFFDDAYNVAVWQWELASPRADVFYAFDGLDEIWTNSKFQHNAISSLAAVPVTIIHMPVVATRVLQPSGRREFGIPHGQFVFLMPFDIGSTSARKNPLAAVEAFKAIQEDHPNTHLILKYHSSKFESGFMPHASPHFDLMTYNEGELGGCMEVAEGRRLAVPKLDV